MQLRIILLLVLINSGLAQGMQQQAQRGVSAQSALKKFPDILYARAFPGTEQVFVRKGELEKIKKIALAGTKEKAAKLPEEMKEVYDWVYALSWAEEHLLNKPFEAWNVDDLCQLNARLTRLTDTTEGKYRDLSAFWTLRTLNPAENALLSHLALLMQNDITPSADQQKWFHEINHSFPPVREIPELMQLMLTQAQTQFKDYKATGKVDIERLVKIATWYHFQLVGIHPWGGANKRTGRVAMLLILAQGGVTLRHVPNFNEYVACFVKHIVKPNAVPLGELIYSLVEK